MQNGALGDVSWIEQAWIGFGKWGSWRGKKDLGGGRIYDLGAHLIDQALQFFPQSVESVYCRTHYDWPDADIESEATIFINFKDKKTAVVDLSSMSYIDKPRYLVKGSNATFVKYGLDPQENAMIAGDIDAACDAAKNYGILKNRKGEQIIPTLPGRWRSYYENFRDALIGVAEPVVSLDEELKLMQVVDAVHKSEKTGQVVYL